MAQVHCRSEGWLAPLNRLLQVALGNAELIASDDGGVLLICPTCQILSRNRSIVPAPDRYFAWGCFRVFLIGRFAQGAQ
jgi:hypothetical protein